MFPLLAFLAGVAGVAVAAAAPPPSAAPVRLADDAFGQRAEIEVRDLPPEVAREVIHRAFAEIADAERRTDPAAPADTGSAVAALNAAAGRGPQPVDARLLALLGRALDYCVWSEGAHGPLARELYGAWGLRAAASAGPAEPPAPEKVDPAATLAACPRLRLDPQKGTAELAVGSALDLWGFAEGFAVDLAVEVLKKNGAANGWVRVGAVQRGFGPGPAGKGWRVELPRLPGLEEPAGEIYLRDRAVAVAAVAAPGERPRLAGTAGPYVNQRTGRPPEGVLAAVAATDTAVDAEGLAASAYVLGPREGQLRLGSLRPRPSVRWFLGTGTGAPLLVDYRWSDVSRR